MPSIEWCIPSTHFHCLISYFKTYLLMKNNKLQQNIKQINYLHN